MIHQRFDVDPVRARRDNEASRILVIRFVAKILDHRQLFRLHLAGDLFHDPAARSLIWQTGDHNITVFNFVSCPRAKRPIARRIDLSQLGFRRNNFTTGREIRPLDMPAQAANSRLRFVEQSNQRTDNLVNIMRRHIGGHADRNSCRSVQQQIRQAGRQQRGFLQCTVEIRGPVDRPVPEFRQQDLGVGG